MAYAPLDFVTIRETLLAEYRNLVSGADTTDDTEIFARASVAAAGFAVLTEGLKYVERQIFPDSADSANLERHAALYSLFRKAATQAVLTARLTGTNGTVVAAGLILAHTDGTQFVTTSGGTIASGILDVTAQASAAGTAGNKSVGTALTVQAPPAGVNATCSVTVGGIGGTDKETDGALAIRVLNRMRLGNAGGTANDYEQWALTIAGVIQADCLALRRGAGTVSVAVFTLGGSGYRTPASAGIRTSVLTYLNTVRPITADVDVPAVTEVSVAYNVSGLVVEAGYDIATVRTAITAAITAYVYGLKAGETDYRTRAGKVISAVPGVLDYTLNIPAANTVPTVSSSVVQVLIPGSITFI